MDLDNKGFQFNSEFESFKMNYQIQNRTVSGLQDRINELEEIQENKEASSPVFNGKNSSNSHADNPLKKNGNNFTIEQKDFDKIIERVDGNDRLIDGLIRKVQIINSKIDESKKVNTPQFNNSNNSTKGGLESRIKNLEKDLEELRLSIPPNTSTSNDGTTHSSINFNIKKMLDSLNRDLKDTKNSVVT